MIARDIMTRKVATIHPEASAQEAAQLLYQNRISGAPVVDADGKLIGVISERDYTRKVALKGKSSKETPVREILSPTVISATPDHTIEECMRLMTVHRVRHLPVLDANTVVGIVSIGDLVNWIISAQSYTIDQLESYITGGYPS